MSEIEHTPKSDWQIDELYKTAWEIIKKHKVLWIFGILAAGSGSSGGNINIPDFSGNSSDTTKLLETTPSPTLPPDHVLGQATSALTETIGQLFAQVPMWIYILLGFELLLFLIYAIVVGVIYNEWVKGSLLSGIQRAIEKKNVSIQESSEHTLSRLRPLIWLGVVPSLLLTLIALPLVMLPVLGLFFAPTAIKIISGLILFVGVIVFVVLSTLLSVSQIWAPRKVIAQHTSGMDALKAGFHIAKKKFWATMLLGLVNSVLGIIVIGIPVIIMVIILIALGVGVGISAAANEAVLIGAILFLTPLILAIVFAIWFLSGLFTAFKAAVWSLAYNKIKGKYDGK